MFSYELQLYISTQYSQRSIKQRTGYPACAHYFPTCHDPGHTAAGLLLRTRSPPPCPPNTTAPGLQAYSGRHTGAVQTSSTGRKIPSQTLKHRNHKNRFEITNQPATITITRSRFIGSQHHLVVLNLMTCGGEYIHG